MIRSAAFEVSGAPLAKPWDYSALGRDGMPVVQLWADHHLNVDDHPPSYVGSGKTTANPQKNRLVDGLTEHLRLALASLGGNFRVVLAIGVLKGKTRTMHALPLPEVMMKVDELDNTTGKYRAIAVAGEELLRAAAQQLRSLG